MWFGKQHKDNVKPCACYRENAAQVSYSSSLVFDGTSDGERPDDGFIKT